MSSRQYLSFLGSVLDFLPEEDKERMAEYWQGLEQATASVYQKFAEANLNTAIKDVLPYTAERWLPYTFNSSNKLNRPAVVTASQDLSVGMRLNTRYLLKLSWDNQAPIEVDLRGANPISTTIDEIKAKINAVAGFQLVRGVFDNTVLQFVSPTSGVNSKITFYPTSEPNRNCIELVVGFLPEDLPLSFPKFPHSYAIPYSKVVEIPTFQDAIREDNSNDIGESISAASILKSGEDYSLESNGVVSFKTEPPAKMWAKRTMVDEETPWNNYGFLMGIYQPNTPGYLAVLQGLWFAFWSGPKPQNIRSAIYLLFGLPTAQEDATVTGLTTESGVVTEVVTTSPAGIVRVFKVPSGLLPEVQLGQSVTRFQPLVTGISVYDKINKPGFIADEIGRPQIKRFLTEQASLGTDPNSDETLALRLLEENTFLPQIQVEAFIRPDINLGNVKTFLSAIQPLNKTFLFQVVVGNFIDTIPMRERLTLGMGIDVTPNLDSNQTTWTDEDLTAYETGSNNALDLDSDGVLVHDQIDVEVRSFGSVIDSFIA